MSQCGGKRTNVATGEAVRHPLVTVVTVVYNNVRGIEKTLDSVLTQHDADFEYVVVDGNSVDGTVDAIQSRSASIDYWVSEPDGGLYEAMNKALYIARGEWILYLMSGDYFQSPTVLRDFFLSGPFDGVDVVFGNAIEESADGTRVFMKPSADSALLLKGPTYRHGASFVRTDVHRRYPFDVSRKKDLGYALDYHAIYRMRSDGLSFKYVDLYVFTYEKEGMSFRPIQNLKYINLITKKSQSLKDRVMNRVKIVFHQLMGNSLGRAAIRAVNYFFADTLLNGVFDRFFLRGLRVTLCHFFGMRCGKNVRIEPRVRIMAPGRICLGDGVRVERGALLDGTGTLVVGNDVVISCGARVLSASSEPEFVGSSRVVAPIEIGAGSFVGMNAIILPGVTALSGSVIAPGSIVGLDDKSHFIVREKFPSPQLVLPTAGGNGMYDKGTDRSAP